MAKQVMVQIDIMILRTVRAGEPHNWIQLVFFDILFALDRGVSWLMLESNCYVKAFRFEFKPKPHRPNKGPLTLLTGFDVSMVKFCSMHVCNLGLVHTASGGALCQVSLIMGIYKFF